MSTTTLSAAASAALSSKNAPEAIRLYTQLLEQSAAPAFYIGRSRSYILSSQPELALADAHSAYHAALSRGHRQSLADSQYRRAVALLRMNRFADADCAARWALQLYRSGPTGEDKETTDVDEEGRYKARKEDVVKEMQAVMGALTQQEKMEIDASRKNIMSVYSFRAQCLGALEKLAKEDEAWKPKVSKTPPKDDKPIAPKASAVVATEATTVKATPTGLDAAKLRTDFYQSTDKATISIFIKPLDKNKVKVSFVPSGSDSAVSSEVQITGFPSGEGDAAIKVITAGTFAIAESTSRVAPMKIELTLKKAPVSKWASALASPPTLLDASATTATPAITPATTEVPAPAATSSGSAAPQSGPVYPTSSKKGPVNWDAVTSETDDGDGRDINAFFKQLYSGATDEQRRAMQKSFLESNGTALSTDWTDVGNRTVETTAPEGVDVKKW